LQHHRLSLSLLLRLSFSLLLSLTLSLLLLLHLAPMLCLSRLFCQLNTTAGVFIWPRQGRCSACTFEKATKSRKVDMLIQMTKNSSRLYGGGD
jgi:hypothetical protein